MVLKSILNCILQVGLFEKLHTADMGQAIRDHLKCYVNSVGAVQWQDRAVDGNPVSIGLGLDIDI